MIFVLLSAPRASFLPSTGWPSGGCRQLRPVSFQLLIFHSTTLDLDLRYLSFNLSTFGILPMTEVPSYMSLML